MPTPDPYADLSENERRRIKYNKNKYAAWNKMNTWVNKKAFGTRNLSSKKSKKK